MERMRFFGRIYYRLSEKFSATNRGKNKRIKNYFIISLAFLIMISYMAFIAPVSQASPDTTAYAAENVARIKETDTYYSSIAQAYNALSSGQTIELLADATLASGTDWKKSFTITSAEGERYTISPANKTTANIFQYVSIGVTVTIENIIFDGLRDENTVTSASCAFYLRDNSTLNIKDGAVIQNFHISTTGVAVFMATGTLNMSGGEIKNNYITNTSGIIHSSAAVEVNITGGEIKDNKIFGKSDTGAVHLAHSNAKLNIGGSAKIYDNYYQATSSSTTKEAKDVYLPSNFYLNQTSDFSGKAYVYAVNDYTKDAKFGNNPLGYAGAHNFINSRDTGLLGMPDGENLKWSDALPIIKDIRITELQAYVDSLTETDYTADNWQAIQGLLANAILEVPELTTVESVEDYTASAKESIYKIDTIALTAAKEDKIAELESYVDNLNIDNYSSEKWQDIQDILAAAISEVQELTTIDAVEYYVEDVKESINEVETIEKIAAKDALLAEIDALLEEYAKSDYATADWNSLTAIIDNAKDQVNGYTTLEQIAEFSLGDVQSACNAIATSENVAVILSTDTYYTSLTDAFAAANALISSEEERAEVKLLKNVNTTAALTINSGAFITLDLNSYTIDRGLKTAIANGAVIINEGNFVLDDNSISGAGVITGGYNSNNPSSSFAGGGIVCKTSSMFVMKGGNISGNQSLYGGGVGLKDNATFILEGGKISQNSIYNTGSGGGVYSDINSTVIIKGGEISYNTAKSGGGGLILIKSSSTMSGGKIYGNEVGGNYGGGGVYINSSSFIMTGGEISLNTSTAHGGGIYQYTTAPIQEFVLAGGAITDNTCASGKNGGAIVVSGNFYVAGDVNITSNVSGGTIEGGILSGGSVNNIYLGAVLVNVGYGDYNAFTGEVGIYSNKYTRNTVFGTIVSDTDISNGIFTNDRDEYLFGMPSDTSLIWEYEFQDAVVITAPTALADGVARQTAIGNDTVTRDITLIALNTTDYNVINDSFDDENPQITYTLKDTTYGVITFNYDLPMANDEGYLWDVYNPPTANSVGQMSATHLDYPGVSVSAVLPILNRDNYSAALDTDENKVVYQLKDDTYGTIIFNLTDSLEQDKKDKLLELFGDYFESNYSPDNWAIVTGIIGEMPEDIIWLDSLEDIEAFTVDNEIFEALDGIPTVKDKQNEVQAELESYYREQTDSQDIPETIETIIQSFVEQVTAENCDDDTAIDAIILNGKIAIAKEIKYAQLDDILTEYNPKLYNTTNWN
ncbi:MAG: hypothetical protein WC292_04960, partial [Clostridia bacterium]